MRISGSLVLLLVTAALTVACSSDKAGDTEKKTGGASSPAQEINKSLTLSQRTGTAAVTLVSVVESFKPDSEIAKSKSGNFVAFNFTFEGKTGSYSVNPLYVYYKKSDGKIIPYDEGDGEFAQPDTEFSGGEGELRVGESVSGAVVFDSAYDKGGSILVTDTMSLVAGEWPLSGGEPRRGDGSPKRELNKSITHKQRNASSAVVTLVSVTESKGGIDKKTRPENGAFLVVDLKFEGKTGEYSVNSLYVKLKKPDGTLIEHDQGNSRYGVGLEEILDAGDLAVGKSLTGKIAFDTAPQPGTKLVLTDIGGKDINGEIPLD